MYCKFAIEKILQIKIADITYPDTEKTIDIRLDSKSIRLDVYVKDNTGRVFDIEMQCTNEKENGLAKRTRYYQAMIDMDVLEKGDDYSKLNPAYIIFICTFDAFDQGLPMYTFRNRCVEQEGIELNDEATKIFLNSKGDSPTLDPDVRAFLRYVDGKAAEGVFVQEVDKEVRRVKQHDETRREYMTLAMELKRMFAEGEKTGEEKGGKKERNDDDIGDAARWRCERSHSKVRESICRIYHRIRKKESLIVIPYNKIYAFWATYDVYLHI